MTDSPQKLAYRHTPLTGNGVSLLRNGGVWEALGPSYRPHQFKARPRGRFGAVWHEVYSVETGEVVGRIN